MPTLNSIGLVEVASIATGYLAQDAMLKAADVELLLARTICSGKYLVVVGGDVASVQAAVDAGAARCRGSLIERRVVTKVHPERVPRDRAVGGHDAGAGQGARRHRDVSRPRASSTSPTPPPRRRTSCCSAFTSRWRSAARASWCMTGDIASVEAAVAAGAAVAADEGILVGKAVIPGPAKELFREFV